MVSCLQEMNLFAFYQVHNAMFLCKSSRPGPHQEVLQLLGFPNPGEGIFQDRLYQIQGS